MKFLIFFVILFSTILHAQALNPEEANDQNEFTDAPEDFTPKIPNQTTPWQPPNYADQTKALGWKPEIFVAPPSMQARVDFWVDIYTKYSTSQGLLHDAYYVDFVYDQVDFKDIRGDRAKSPRQQKKAIEKLIKDKRHAIQDRLMKLSKLSSGDGLAGEDLRYWTMFTRLHDKNRFTDAADQSRIRFQLGQSDRFLQGIFYSGRYLKQMEAIFREEGLPVELTRLPFVESSFNIFARSKVGASGVWQFMRRTAKLYMKVNNAVDERNDPLRAARSAARMLRQNYQFLGNWPLAITGWNHGPTGVHKIVKKLGTDDLSKIVSTYSSRSFGFASENFYASFLAALYAEGHANKYFTNIKWSRELDNEEFRLSRTLPFVTLKAFFDSDLDRTLLLNPQFQSQVRKGRAPIPVGSYVHIPKSRSAIMNKYLKDNISINEATKQLAELSKAMPIDTQFASVAVPVSTPAPVAATPAFVAVAMNPVLTPVAVASSAIEVASATALQTPQVVPTLQDAVTKLEPSPTPTTSASPVVGTSEANPVPSEKIETPPAEYKVRRGDNLTRIAKRFHISPLKLIKANPEFASAKLMPGMKIHLPQAEK